MSTTTLIVLAILALIVVVLIVKGHRTPDPYEGLGMLDQQAQAWRDTPAEREPKATETMTFDRVLNGNAFAAHEPRRDSRARRRWRLVVFVGALLIAAGVTLLNLYR